LKGYISIKEFKKWNVLMPTVDMLAIVKHTWHPFNYGKYCKGYWENITKLISKKM
jgi:hypothetical protein